MGEINYERLPQPFGPRNDRGQAKWIWGIVMGMRKKVKRERNKESAPIRGKLWWRSFRKGITD